MNTDLKLLYKWFWQIKSHSIATKKHLSDLNQKRGGSVLWKHAHRKHGEIIPHYRMNVTGVYRQDAMKRQIAEAVQIGDAGLAMLMNDKTEWQLNHVLQLTTTTER